MINKNSIRKHIKQAVLNLTTDQKTTAAQGLTDLTLFWEKTNIRNWNNFACYWTTKCEIHTIGLINNLLTKNKNCYLPYINNTNTTLSFLQYDLNTKLIKNQFDILEPEFDINKTINIKNIELIFMPIVAFDSLGHRIGSGGGWYDRTLAEHKNSNSNYPILIGLAYSIQQIENFTPDDWDVDLDIIITEQKIFNFRSKV